MPDSANPAQPFKPLDPGRINTLDPEELAYWCLEIGCTAPELLQAVAEAGEHTAAVRTHLAKHRP